MASLVDRFAAEPPGKKLLIWALGAGLMVAGLYTSRYDRLQAEQEQTTTQLRTAETELAQLTAQLKALDAEREKVAQLEQEAQAAADILPVGDGAVETLIQVFQHQAQTVGLSLDSWTPGAEQRQNAFATLPVQIKGRGSFHQLGEFLRLLTELKQIVSIDKTILKLHGQELSRTGNPVLEIELHAATYRLLSDGELASGVQGKSAAKPKSSSATKPGGSP